MNEYIENTLSTKIYNKVYKAGTDQEVAIDPATLFLISKISITVIRTIKKCKDLDDDRTKVIQSPERRDSRILKRIVRRELGWVKYLLIGNKVVSAMKEMGTELTHDDLERSELFNNNDSFTVYGGEKYYEL